MPDHWHGLVEIHRQDNLSVLIGRLKGHSARLLRQKHAHLGWIWARAYHDHAVADRRGSCRHRAVYRV
jgi:REP element-mobilizing transposase RayT